MLVDNDLPIFKPAGVVTAGVRIDNVGITDCFHAKCAGLGGDLANAANRAIFCIVGVPTEIGDYIVFSRISPSRAS